MSTHTIGPKLYYLEWEYDSPSEEPYVAEATVTKITARYVFARVFERDRHLIRLSRQDLERSGQVWSEKLAAGFGWRTVGEILHALSTIDGPEPPIEYGTSAGSDPQLREAVERRNALADWHSEIVRHAQGRDEAGVSEETATWLRGRG